MVDPVVVAIDNNILDAETKDACSALVGGVTLAGYDSTKTYWYRSGGSRIIQTDVSSPQAEQLNFRPFCVSNMLSHSQS
jgi:hypothetical protein